MALIAFRTMMPVPASLLSPAEVHALPQIQAWDAEVDARGIRRGGARLRPSSYATTVRVRDGELLVSDGPSAAIAQTPTADGPPAARNAARHQKPLAMARFTGRGILDALGGLIGRPSLLIPLTAEPGTVALLTTPDALDGDWALNAESYPDWQREVAARSALRTGFYRPGRAAPRVRCPLLVVVCDQDQSALAEPAARAARRAPRGELVRLPGGHYAPFLGAHERAVQAELSFLRRNLLEA